jgi:pimeloyl-ACP methyl ester carboxylesterase
MTANFKVIVEAGTATPWLVMVHGMTQDHRVSSAQVAGFRTRFRILLIDLPGHGMSTGIPSSFGHHELAAEVSGAMQEAGVESCHYWATHTGTSLGLLLAVENPKRFHSLILEGPVIPGQVLPSVKMEIERACDTAQSDGLDAALRQWFDAADWFEVIRQNPEACRAGDHWRMVSEFAGAPWLYGGPPSQIDPIDDHLEALDIPALIYNGEHDLDDFQNAAGQLQSLLPNARRELIAGGGGFPGWEYPGAVNELAERFLNGVDDIE